MQIVVRAGALSLTINEDMNLVDAAGEHGVCGLAGGLPASGKDQDDRGLAALEFEGVPGIAKADGLGAGQFSGVEGKGEAVVAGDGELALVGVPSVPR